MSYTRFKLLIATASEWYQHNPILLNGELGLEKQSDNTFKIKIGDGVSHWADLDYAVDFQAIEQARQDAINAFNEASALVESIDPDSLLLLGDEIKNTATTITKNAAGDITKVVYKRGNTVIRTDDWTIDGNWLTGIVTIRRTLQNGKYVIVTTNLDTGEETTSEIMG